MERKFALRRRRAPAPWRPGLEEEAAKRTDTVLRGLIEREWTVLKGADHRHGVDHVVVGPGGVFAICSRFPEAAGARVRDGLLWLRRDTDARSEQPGVAINRQALDAARSLFRQVRARTGRGPQVHPVVVLWCEFPQRIAESRQIAFVHGRDLRLWLMHRQPELDEAGRQLIVQALNAIGDRERRPRVRLRYLSSRGRLG